MWPKLLLVVWLALQALSHVAEAQQPKKVARVGYLFECNGMFPLETIHRYLEGF
jgi:hypothetical protein